MLIAIVFALDIIGVDELINKLITAQDSPKIEAKNAGPQS